MSDAAVRTGDPPSENVLAMRTPPPQKISTTAGFSLGGGLALATVHWAMKCSTGGHWHFVAPEDALIEWWLFLMLPTGHLIGRIIYRYLKRLAGEEE